MKICGNYMDDFVIILAYEFFQVTHPIWYNLFLIIFHQILLKIKKYLYIPVNKNINLQKVLLTYNNNIVLCNSINLNYYHINTIIDNRKIQIVGNNNYVMINHSFFKINEYDKILRTPYSEIIIYKLPIKIYDKSECCVCLINEGTLIGVCGHQNVCSECMCNIHKCPICNNHILFNKLDSRVINYLELS